ncbi:hypothetical protein Pcinc_038018 [Petrolisthes cinctipes]|uniref:Uncharacterized protein n=1 Tax=Petrolisthes cinctipes TaxID=88211 RepID=A0AAE1BRW3_PETCI|nr:hypothetical protein Pcinc_038018 [Petrolisthes cinctipes]
MGEVECKKEVEEVGRQVWEVECKREGGGGRQTVQLTAARLQCQNVPSTPAATASHASAVNITSERLFVVSGD